MKKIRDSKFKSKSNVHRMAAKKNTAAGQNARQQY